MHNEAPFIAANRLGLGALPGEISRISSDPQGWLLSSMEVIRFPKTETSIASNYIAMDESIDITPESNTILSNRADHNTYFRELINNSAVRMFKSEASFNWRVLDFLSNHFSVSAQGKKLKVLVPSLERDAIAPNMYGPFSALLVAVTRHPAMLIYLNNSQSLGPNSWRGLRNGRGLNENLAREILELHTLGVNGGYTQADVIELAKAIAGWTVSPATSEAPNSFTFKIGWHEPGPRTVLKRSYPAGGLDQGAAILEDLAMHPATASHICRKIVRHFVSDAVDEKLVTHLSSTWLGNQGSLKHVFEALLRHPACWQLGERKFKNPRDFYFSVARATGWRPSRPSETYQVLLTLGQPPFGANSPAGWPDENAFWLAAQAIQRRLTWSRTIAESVRTSAIPFMHEFTGRLSNSTEAVLRSAESRSQALTLGLLSPEFLRR